MSLQNSMFSSPYSLLFSALLGIVPAVIWLLFWLREDRVHPEPKRLIFLSFLVGMAIVPIIVPIQDLAQNIIFTGIGLVVAWAIIEELAKYAGAYIASLHTKAVDEPIDEVIYLIATALGFAALENVLFLVAPHVASSIFLGLAASNIRFVGATLLHVVASGAIGVSAAFSFYKSTKTKIYYRIGGVITAVALHVAFNLFILQGSGDVLFASFFLVWIAVILLLVFVEKIKKNERKHPRNIIT